MKIFFNSANCMKSSCTFRNTNKNVRFLIKGVSKNPKTVRHSEGGTTEESAIRSFKWRFFAHVQNDGKVFRGALKSFFVLLLLIIASLQLNAQDIEKVLGSNDFCVGESSGDVYEFQFYPPSGCTIFRWWFSDNFELAPGYTETDNPIQLYAVSPGPGSFLNVEYNCGSSPNPVFQYNPQNHPNALINVLSRETLDVVISIDDGDNILISGEQVKFVTNVVDEGTNPVFNWRVNGLTVFGGSGSAYSTYTTDQLQTGDKVTLQFFSNLPCTTSPLSNEIIMLSPGDNGLNWIFSKTFDQDGTTIVGAGKTYFDFRGQPLQSQTKVPNEGGGYDLFASQSVYDKYDRPVLSTMSAPLDATNFVYQPDFILNGSGEAFSHADIEDRYDLPGVTETGAGPVGQGAYGSLGWYYSDANTLEPLQATTQYPYSLTQYYDDGSGEVKRTAGPGEFHRMSQGHEGYSKTFPLLQELNPNLGEGAAKNYSYLSIRNTYVFPAVENRIDDMAFKGVKTVSIDANGAEVITFSDENGNVLATATSNPTNVDANAAVTVKLSATLDDETLPVFDFHIPNNGDLGQVGSSTQVNATGGTNLLYLYDLRSEAHGVPYTSVSTPVDLNLPPSFYRAQDGDNAAISYDATYYNWSYNYYDEQGRLVISISPNSIKQLREGVAYTDIDKTTYTYNHQGWLLEMTEPDAGTTQYIYRKDGSIRFSQNAQQADTSANDPARNFFSYTKYDQVDRPIESGEYTGSELFDRTGLAGYLEDRGYNSFPLTDRKDVLYTYYDFRDTPDNFPDYDGFGNLPSNEEDQTYIRGAVSFTLNDNIKTWYSYDEFGQVEWMIQKPKDLDDYFHIEYQYDYFGNVTQVKFYRKDTDGNELDPFYHHYTYDKQQRLQNVYTSTDGSFDPLNPLAHYVYYHHGPLKRVELGVDGKETGKQGIDYVYTLHGWLKGINHPDAGNDPGEDGVTGSPHAGFAEDLFAMTLEYYNSDYDRTGVNIASVTEGKEYFNGNITSATWRTGAALNGATPVMYSYDYDNAYQLTAANFGTPDYTNGTFASLADQYRVNNLKYDLNGNIKSLVRYGGMLESGGGYKKQEDFLDKYLYAANKNQLTEITGYANYQYNEIGQLEDETLLAAGEEGASILRHITYDVTGKVINVGITEGENLQENVDYEYDDRGFRLMKRSPDGKETWYIRDAGGNVLTTYEKLPDSELEPKEHMIYGSGRIGMYQHDFVKLDPDKGYISGDEYRNQYEDKDYELLPGASLTLTEGFEFDAVAAGKSFTVDVVDEAEILGATVYEMTDHLGNVRIAMTQEETSVDFKTNLENPDGGGFMNMHTRHQGIAKNHTPGGSWSSWLNPAAENGYTVGPAITLMVSPGDVVNMKVFGMYTSSTGGDETLTEGVASAVAGSMTQTGGLEATEVANLFSQLLSGAAFIPQVNSDIPKAYLKYILFDRNMVMKQNGHKVLEGSPNTWEELSLQEISIEQAGYIYIYVANESEAGIDVHFDDMEVQLIEAPAVNGTDYYPYGLAMDGRSWTCEPYRFGYQGQFSEYDDETGWNAFELRMYDSKIGRWIVPDPEKLGNSLYIGLGNNPIMFNDTNGGRPDWFVDTKTGSVLEAPGKGENYVNNLGENWKWLAKDGAIKVTFELSQRAFSDGQNSKIWDFESSKSIMEFNDFLAVPLKFIQLEKYSNNLPSSEIPSISNSIKTQIWISLTYVPENSIIDDKKIKTLWQTDHLGGWSLITEQEFEYAEGSYLDRILNMGKKISKIGKEFEYPYIYIGWDQYPEGDSYLEPFRPK